MIATPIADPQAEDDTRGISLDQVGISKVKYPLLISGWDSSNKGEEIKECLVAMRVSLAAEKRGIHMSRLLESLHQWDQAFSLKTLPEFLTQLRTTQGSTTAFMSCHFTWFIERPTPETKKNAWQGIETTLFGELTDASTIIGYTLKIPITTLCPCSKEISDYGAHSQRGWVEATLQWKHLENIIAPQEIFEQLQHAGSAPIYPLLKRADERHVTMLAYDQPAFVEDTARKAADILKKDHRIERFQLNICNEESIHTHDAVANLSYSII